MLSPQPRASQLAAPQGREAPIHESVSQLMKNTERYKHSTFPRGDNRHVFSSFPQEIRAEQLRHAC